MPYIILTINLFITLLAIILIISLARNSSSKKDLIKPILIITIISLILIGSITIFQLADENYTKTQFQKQTYDEQGNMLMEVPLDNLYLTIPGGASLFLWMFILPLLVIILSARYLLKNPNSYGKSLLIPISYILINYLLTILWAYATNVQGEEGMAFLYFYALFTITFIATAIINFIIYLIKRTQ
ncbi:MAG: hypothetical protein KJ592_01695 [Nanoarchaeota archaeon]|nr:hypothetical protein [Nanoarchaeota archaeon]